nr:MAG: ORF1 [TTV-like mini virus]
MPYFYRRKRYPNRFYFRRRTRWRPRRRPYFWRLRQALRRRRSLYRRRNWVRKRYRHKRKLPYLKLKTYQPPKINKCHIKGTINLFQCGPHRLHYNYTQYMNSITPEFWEGGGGWSQIKFTLASLFEQRDLLKNKWTKSNVQMPLCRYISCKFKFWRQYDIDYIVHYSTCLPMLDTFYQHVNAHPYNMLLYKTKIVVRSQKSRPNKKPYKYIRIKPPEQYTNQWYFQADFASQGLVMLTTTAADFNRLSLNPKSISSSITIRYLNTKVFKNHNFKQASMGTAYWSPNSNNYYYITLNGRNSKVRDLHYCGQTTVNTLGKPIGNNKREDYLNRNNWSTNLANIFHHEILHGQVTLWVSTKGPYQMFEDNNKDKSLTDASLAITESTAPLIKQTRYNPERDKGDNNTAYIKDIFTHPEGWEPPEDPDLIYDGYPFWCLLWGLEDWIRKYKKLQNMYTDYIMVLRTDTMFDPETEYVVIDWTYTDGYSPYQEKPNNADYNTWQPCLRQQMLTIEDICASGPLTCKTSTTSIEAHCSYDFFLKWGGCPSQLENIADPEKQKHYPTPHNISEGPQIENPETPAEYQIYPFDVRRETVTKKAAKRIKSDFTNEYFTSTDSKLNSEPTYKTIETFQEENETSSEEETETPILQQLDHLRQHRKRLQRRINKLISKTPNIKL